LFAVEKQRQPCTCCTRCGRVGYDIALSNQPCRRVLDRKGTKCKGAISSAINIGDWEECLTCRGSGASNATTCEPCSGAGWIFVRDRPWLKS
jgi:hypothetical protein